MGRVVEPGEPWFLEEDTDAVLEWQREQNLKCPGCGLPRDETMQKEHHEHYDATALRCHACAARDNKAKEFIRQEHDDAGLFFVVRETNA